MSIFRDVINEYYVADCSKKIRAVLKSKAANGRHASAHAPFGYMPSAEDKFVWAIDEPAARIVREIFKMFISGMGPFVIANRFRARGLKTPGAYKAERDGKPQRNKSKYSDTNWTDANITSILDNLEYTGTAVMQKYTTKSYKDHRRYIKPEDEWVTCEDAHPAIVERETFETAKRLRQGRRRINKSGDTGILNGLLVCGDCGGKLHLKRQIKKGVEYCYFECRNARNRNENATCSCHAVKREPLEQLVLEEIQQIVQCAKSSEGKLMEKLRASEGLERRQALKTAETEFAKTKQRIAELDRIISKIYEDNVTGKLSDERFSIMLAGFEAEQSELKARAAEYEGVLRAENAQSENVHRFLNLVRRFTEPTELTAELAREFIEKIVIGRAEHIGVGHHTKRQKVKIVYNHIGEGSDSVMETSRN